MDLSSALVRALTIGHPSTWRFTIPARCADSGRVPRTVLVLLIAVTAAPAADAAFWRGAAGPFRLGLQIRAGHVAGEVALDGVAGRCSPTMPLGAATLPAAEFRRGRVAIDTITETRRGPDGIRLRLRRAPGGLTGTVRLAFSGMCDARRHVTLHLSGLRIRPGRWTGTTDQDTKVGFWVSPFGTHMTWDGPPGPVAPTVLAGCPDGTFHAGRPGPARLLLQPDGTFATGDVATGSGFAGRFHDARVRGGVRLAQDDCDSGPVRWTAAPAG